MLFSRTRNLFSVFSSRSIIDQQKSNNNSRNKLRLYSLPQQNQQEKLLTSLQENQFRHQLEKSLQKRKSTHNNNNNFIMPKSRTKLSIDEANAKTQALLDVINVKLPTQTNKNKIESSSDAIGAVVDPPPKMSPKQKQQLVVPEAPKNWHLMYNAIVRMRAALPAAVDVIGCHMLADRAGGADEETQRFQTLVALMLSAQTRDQCTAAAIKKLQSDIVNINSNNNNKKKLPQQQQQSTSNLRPYSGGLTVASIAAATVDEIRECISMTCFFNNKARYISETAKILVRDHGGRVPRKLEDILKLPGVGKKMAHIFKECADGEVLGIGVDTHMHRMFRNWKWTGPPYHHASASTTPDDTMHAMQRWLPMPYWRNVNEVMVGFGQSICGARNPLCGPCLARHWCPAANLSPEQRAQEKGLADTGSGGGSNAARAVRDIEDLAVLKERTAVARGKLVEEFGMPKAECEWLAPPPLVMMDQNAKPLVIRSHWLSPGERRK